MKSYEIQKEYVEFIRIDEMAANWDRAKVPLGARLRPQTVAQATKNLTPETHEIS